MKNINYFITKGYVVYLINLSVAYLIFYAFSPYRNTFQSQWLESYLILVSLLFAVAVIILDGIVFFRDSFMKLMALSSSVVVANIIIIVVDISNISTAHNLAPLELIFSGFCSFVVFSALSIVLKIIALIQRRLT